MVTADDISRVALLARLSLTEEETARLAEQLSTVLQHFEHVSKVETINVEPMVTATDIVEFWREDQAVNWESADAAMKNAPETVGNLFKVPPVVG